MLSLLHGLRILDLSRLLPGPMGTLLLADLGAEVIKVEQPGIGDYARWLPPKITIEGAGFLALNRNKKSIALDLSKPAGVEVFLRLAEQADVILESFRPGKMTSLGIDYETVSSRNKKIIYCSLTGYGQQGPHRDKAGHDLNYMALSGLLNYFSKPGEKPYVPPVQLADIGGGTLPAVIAILAALINRDRTGKGEYIDISMLDGLTMWTVLLHAAAQAIGRDPRPAEGFLAGAVPCYNVYQTADNKYLTVGAIEPKFWKNLVTLMGCPEFEEEQFSEGKEGRKAIATLQQLFETNPLDYWLELFSGQEVCVEPVLSLQDAFAQLHHQERKTELTLNHQLEGDLRQLRIPYGFAKSSDLSDQPPPGLGQHSLEILRSCGFSEAEIKSIRADGITN